MCEITLDCKAVPKERPRFSKYGVYTPSKTTNFEKLVGYMWKLKYKDFKFTTAIKVECVFCYKLPKSAKGVLKDFVRRPDIDNLVKSILDGLNQVAFEDDKQITELYAKKMYADSDKILIKIND